MRHTTLVLLFACGLFSGGSSAAAGNTGHCVVLVLRGSIGQAGFTVNHFTDVDQAVADDDYDVALQLLDTLRSAARESGDRSLQREVTDYTKEVRRLQDAYEDVASYGMTLMQSPDDREANQVIGQFRCTVKGDWEHGLPLLAKGDDQILRNIARVELNEPSAAEAQLAVANAWWTYADSQPASARHPYDLRGRYWYLRARPGLDVATRVDPDRHISRIPLYADRIVVWNQHNEDAGDRGTVNCVVTILDDGRTRRRIPVTLPWSENSPAWSSIRIPRTPLDQVRVDILSFRGRGGGLAEVEVFDGQMNISRRCSAVADHYWEDEARFHPRNVTNGNTSGHDGIWLLNNSKTGWILVNLDQFVEQQ